MLFNKMEFIGIIPARYKSKRFPGKPIADLLGKPMIWHVYQSAKKADKWKKLLVATDDERIMKVCESYQIPCMMTKHDHPDCIDRAAEVAIRLESMGEGADRYIVIQGDEPMFDASILDTDFSPSVVNLYTELVNKDELDDNNCVKVVVSKNLKAIYFSRYSIPYHGDITRKGSYMLKVDKQIGIYSFSIEALKQFIALGMSYLEGTEGIGMLRFIENDIDVHMRYAQYDSFSVDTEEDLKFVESIMKLRGQLP